MLVEVRDARCDRHHDQKFSCNSSACLTLPAQIEALSGYDPPFDRLPWKTVGAKLQTAYSRMLLALEGSAVIRKSAFWVPGLRFIGWAPTKFCTPSRRMLSSVGAGRLRLSSPNHRFDFLSGNAIAYQALSHRFAYEAHSASDNSLPLAISAASLAFFGWSESSAASIPRTAGSSRG
jgi:hypothetical protein